MYVLCLCSLCSLCSHMYVCMHNKQNCLHFESHVAKSTIKVDVAMIMNNIWTARQEACFFLHSKPQQGLYQLCQYNFGKNGQEK